MGDDGEAEVTVGFNEDVLSVKLLQFAALCFKGSFKTTFVRF
jgi:hypothetical protein